jgi:uncharacterized membrane protein (DUF4010 family)
VDPYEPFLSIALAAAAGLLVGLEREQSAPQDRTAESFLGGARTFPLVAVAGALAMLLAHSVGASILVGVLAAISVFLVVNYADDIRRGADRGITSEVAFLATFLLGALAPAHDLVPSLGRRVLMVLGSAVMVTALLSSKPTLHPLVRRVSREDVVSVLKFLIVALVLVPWLPDRAFGPLEAVNPRTIGWMMLLVAGVSFVGYAATRLLGPERGLSITGFVGGLVSSTAVTLAMSSRAKAEPRIARPAALAVVLASTIVFPRVLVIVFVVNPALARELVVPLAAMACAGMAASGFLYRRSASAEVAGPVNFKNPVSLSSAFEFALLFAVVLVVSKAASVHLGTAGVLAASVAAGTTDMDAIALSMAKLAPAQVSLSVAATAVVLAAATNTVVKGIMAAALGGWAFTRLVLASFGAILAAGALALLSVWR